MAIKKAESNVKANENFSEAEKALLTVTEKKIRNLEKRKAKLDGYKSIVEQGASLDPDQKLAADKYDEVVGALSATKELYKTFTSMCVDNQKTAKKAKQRQALEQQELDLVKFQKMVKLFEVFKLVSINEKVQLDLSTPMGEEESAVLTEEELDMIADFFNNHMANISYEEGSNVLQVSDQIGEKLYLLCCQPNSKKATSTCSYSILGDVYQKLIESNYFKELPNVFALNEDGENVDDDVEDLVVVLEENGIVEESETDEPAESNCVDELLDVPAVEFIPELSLDEEDSTSISGDIKTTEFVASEVVIEGNVSSSISPKIEFAIMDDVLPEPVAEEVEEEPLKTLSIKDILKQLDGDYFGQDNLGIEFEIPENVSSTEVETNCDALASESQINSYNGIETAPTMNNIESESSSINTVPSVINSHPQPNIYSTAPPKSDSLGMGQTTFGNHGSYTTAPQNAQLSDSMYQTGNFHMHPEMHKPMTSVENTPLNVHPQLSAILPSAMSVPDPPKAPIPMPNEELNYKSFNSNMNTQELNSLGDNNVKTPQDDSVLHLMRQRQSTSLLSNDGAASLLSNENSHVAPLNKSNSETHYHSNTNESMDDTNQVLDLSMKDRTDVSMSNHVNSKQNSEVTDMMSVDASEVCGKGDHLSANDSNGRVNRGSGYNSNQNYTKQNSAYRQQGSQIHTTYFPRGGGNNNNYRGNNQRSYNNYDGRTHGANYQTMYTPYRAQDNSGMYNGMRRGNSNPRGGRGGNGRNGGRPFNRSRTFRPQASEQQTF